MVGLDAGSRASLLAQRSAGLNPASNPAGFLSAVARQSEGGFTPASSPRTARLWTDTLLKGPPDFSKELRHFTAMALDPDRAPLSSKKPRQLKASRLIVTERIPTNIAPGSATNKDCSALERKMKKVQLEDDEPIWVLETTIDEAPVTIFTEVEQADSQALLAGFADRLPSVWATIYSTMKTGFCDYGHSEEFPPEQFLISLSRMSKEYYMGDKSSLHVRFEFEWEDFSDTIPFYDFYLNDDFDIVHHQPVF